VTVIGYHDIRMFTGHYSLSVEIMSTVSWRLALGSISCYCSDPNLDQIMLVQDCIWSKSVIPEWHSVFLEGQMDRHDEAVCVHTHTVVEHLTDQFQERTSSLYLVPRIQQLYI